MRPHLLIALILIVALASPARGDEITLYADKIQAILSERNIHSMLDIARVLKEAGASYQPSLTAPVALAPKYGPGEELRVMIGVYQFDSLYAAAFGRKKETAEALKAQSTLVDRLNLRGKVDVSAIFPPKLNSMLTNPYGLKVDEAVRAYAEGASGYGELMREPGGFDVIESSLYGFVVEGLYVITKTIAQSGYSADMLRLLIEFRGALTVMTDFYKTFDPAFYAAKVDPSNPKEQAERLKWLLDLADIIDKSGGKLTREQVNLYSLMLDDERQRIFKAI